MFKLNAQNKNATIKFEQIFDNYELMREKEKELIATGLITIVTMLTKEQADKYPEAILEELRSKYSNNVGN